MKKIMVLGSTGQIGQAALDIVRSFPHEFKVTGLANYHGGNLFKKQVQEFKPTQSVITKKQGNQALIDLVKKTDSDLIIMAVVGTAGLQPSITALQNKKTLALATKEVLVLAGSMILKTAKQSKTQIIPLDSELSALFQSLKSGHKSEIDTIYLTMGTGKIAKMSIKQQETIKPQDIANRKTWSMGAQIAIDSATCVNKIYEMIEVKHLFNLKAKQIKVTVHPEYLCHSLIKFKDGSYITELGIPDMRRYLQYAMLYPQRKTNNNLKSLDIIGKSLTFHQPAFHKFPFLQLGRKLLTMPESYFSVLHGANTVASQAFYNNRIKFPQIYEIVEKVINKHTGKKKLSLENILAIEKWARNQATSIIKAQYS